MFEQDYIQRLIHDIARVLAKLIFHKDSDGMALELSEDEEAQDTLEDLNEKDDAFLQEHHFSRGEIKSGIDDLIVGYGISGITELFLE